MMDMDRAEISSMLAWAEDSFRGAFVEKDAVLWEKRIGLLKEIIGGM